MATGRVPTFRDAEPDERSLVARLQHAAADALTARHGPGPWSMHVKPGGGIDDPRLARVRLGVMDGEIVTVLRLQTRKPWAIDVSYFTPVGRAIYLTNLAVSPVHQGAGLGRLAMEDARAVAVAWPADAIRLDSYDAAAGAGAFYARCGYADRGRVIYRGTPLAYHELLLG